MPHQESLDCNQGVRGWCLRERADIQGGWVKHPQNLDLELNNFLVKEKAVHMESNWCLESVV